MPTQKDFKRVVRRRMQKTGESYTAARARVLASPSSSKSRSTDPPPSRPDPLDYAKRAGMSDAAIEAKTGRTWKEWVEVLDAMKADAWPHQRIADYVHAKFGVPGWWTQTVTVGYERIRGLREIGQRRGGSFEATKSRTFPVPAATLYKAFAVARQRTRWLPGIQLTVRKATPNRSLRITWHDGTSVEVSLTGKGATKSSAQIQHRKLPDKEAVARAKAQWEARLDALAKLLSVDPLP